MTNTPKTDTVREVAEKLGYPHKKVSLAGDPIWNTACDYVINDLLVSFPSDSQYDGLTSEEIYAKFVGKGKSNDE